VLRVLRDVCQVDTGLLRLGRTTMSGMHSDGTGDAGSISNLSVEIPIVPTSNGHAAIVSYQGATTFEARNTRERYLQQRIRRHVVDSPGVRLRCFKIELTSCKVFEAQSRAPDLTTVND
jgi:hypothetical protein